MKYLNPILWISLAIIIFNYSSGENLSTDILQNKLIHLAQLVEKAESVNGLWRETKSIQNKAIDALNNNNADQAMVLINLAEQQAILGYEQAISQKNIDQLVPIYLRSNL